MFQMCSDEIILSKQAKLIFISPKLYNYDLLFLHKCIGQNKTYQVTDTHLLIL